MKGFNEKAHKAGRALSEVGGVVKSVGNAVLRVFKVNNEIEKNQKQVGR